ncbi:glycerol kinase GlpK [Leucobacter allii]|uniref:Glycerol kinase n=1 Tax=Leucobacter allii TaxID=2932247 RepID=A0ABY4FNJ8_9MICO|nr:glycerol kinase GlpK [Leucobacter allii]UOQ57858.1 glycerol kinase GlpK [Leucobacter allii]
MAGPYVIAFDAGTSSVRAVIVDGRGEIAGIAQREITQYYPNPGWVEQDANEIWSHQRAVAHEALAAAGVPATEIAAIGVANQRETVVVWDRATGEPVHRALVWQDGRTAADCEALLQLGRGSRVRELTGLPIDKYFSASKLRWILDNVEGARARAEAGELAAGTIDTWLAWKLTDGRAHVTDASNASRTLLFDIGECAWSEELLELFSIPRAVLPEVRGTSEVYGVTGEQAGFGVEIPLAALVGDQQGALFGQACFDSGSVKATYGTGGSVVMNTGSAPTRSDGGLLTTVAWKLGGQVTYALEGLLFAAGAPVRWLRDELGVIADAAESEEIAATVPDSGGIYFVPAFSGLSSPQWDPYARALIIGMSQGAGRAHIVRAAIESMSYSYRDVIEVMVRASGRALPSLRVDGGAATNALHLQFQADQLGVPVRCSSVMEATARGAAFLAGLAVGVWASVDELRSFVDTEREYLPAMAAEERDARYRGWTRAVERSRDWVEH